MNEAIGVALGLVGGAIVLGLFFVASRIDALRARLDIRLDRIEERMAGRR